MAGQIHGGARALIAIVALFLIATVYFASRASPGDHAPEARTEATSTPVATPRTSAQSALDGGDGAPARASIVPDAPAEIAAATPVARSRPRGRFPPPRTEFPPRVRTEAGVIEVIVLEGDTPLPGVPVAIYAAESGPAPELLSDVTDRSRWSRTDARGLVRFEALTPGDYGIRAWVEPDIVLTGGRVPVRDARGQRYHLRAGRGIVHGRIYGPDRAPLADARLEMIAEVDRGHPLNVVTRSDAQGRFRFAGLPAGFYKLFHAEEWTAERALPARARFYLEPGETLAVDLGSPTAPTVWTGTVRASSGEAVALAMDVKLDEANHGNELALRTDDHGRFRVELPPGEYIVSPEDVWGAPGFLHVVVGDEPFERDLVASGVVLRARLLPEKLAWPTSMHLRPVDGTGAPHELRSEEWRGTAERYWCVSAPRPHRLAADGPGTIRGAPPEGLEVDLTGRSGLVTIDVEFEPR